MSEGYVCIYISIIGRSEEGQFLFEGVEPGEEEVEEFVGQIVRYRVHHHFVSQAGNQTLSRVHPGVVCLELSAERSA